MIADAVRYRTVLLTTDLALLACYTRSCCQVLDPRQVDHHPQFVTKWTESKKMYNALSKECFIQSGKMLKDSYEKKKLKSVTRCLSFLVNIISWFQTKVIKKSLSNWRRKAWSYTNAYNFFNAESETIQRSNWYTCD